MPKYDNSLRLSGVPERDWRMALDELTAYITWRLRGKKTRWGAHSECELGIPALDYYTEEAAIKLIEGSWKWQERYTLGQQLIEIASNLITKQAEKYARQHPPHPGNPEHPLLDETVQSAGLIEFAYNDPLKDPYATEEEDLEAFPDVMEEDAEEELDETYAIVMDLVKDNRELVFYVEAIRACGHFNELPEYLGVSIKHVYRLQEKLMRRIRRWKTLTAMLEPHASSDVSALGHHNG